MLLANHTTAMSRSCPCAAHGMCSCTFLLGHNSRHLSSADATRRKSLKRYIIIAIRHLAAVLPFFVFPSPFIPSELQCRILSCSLRPNLSWRIWTLCHHSPTHELFEALEQFWCSLFLWYCCHVRQTLLPPSLRVRPRRRTDPPVAQPKQSPDPQEAERVRFIRPLPPSRRWPPVLLARQ